MADMSAWSRMLAAEATPTLGPCLAPASALGLAAAGGDLASLSLAGPGSRGLSSTARPGSGEPRLSIPSRVACSHVSDFTQHQCSVWTDEDSLIPQRSSPYFTQCRALTMWRHTPTGRGFRLVNATKIIDGHNKLCQSRTATSAYFAY